MDKYISTILIILSFSMELFCCSIFIGIGNENVLAAGNEDSSDPISKIWTSPKTENQYGCISLGSSDLQAQFTVNEHGLFYDYAFIDDNISENECSKEKFQGDLFYEIARNCRTIDEVKEYLTKYCYFGDSQVLIGDSTGKSIIVNRDTIASSKKHYQITTNFNTCKLAAEDYSCLRYDIIEEVLSKEANVNFDNFRSLLSRSRQEGKISTQYSYIIDLENKELFLYSFHDFENPIKFNIDSEITKDYKINDLKGLFPLQNAEHENRERHINSKINEVIKISRSKGAIKGKEKVDDLFSNKKINEIEYMTIIWVSGLSLVRESWLAYSQGKPFTYWWSPEIFIDWKSTDPQLVTALHLFEYLEGKQKPPEYDMTLFEMIGLVHYIKNDKIKSQEYFKKAISLTKVKTKEFERMNNFIEN